MLFPRCCPSCLQGSLGSNNYILLSNSMGFPYKRWITRSDVSVRSERVPHLLNMANIDSSTYPATVYHDYTCLFLVRYAGFIVSVTCLILFLTVGKLFYRWCWQIVAVSMDTSMFAARILRQIPVVSGSNDIVLWFHHHISWSNDTC